eukprot:UN28417
MAKTKKNERYRRTSVREALRTNNENSSIFYTSLIGLLVARESGVWNTEKTSGTFAIFQAGTMSDLARHYYLIEFGWYFHRAITSPLSYKREDYKEMLFHHIITTLLIAVSYITQFHKIGTMVMFLHDVPDAVLALAKTLHYFHISPWDDLGFVGLGVAWIVFVYIYSLFIQFICHINRTCTKTLRIFRPLLLILCV